MNRLPNLITRTEAQLIASANLALDQTDKRDRAATLREAADWATVVVGLRGILGREG